MAAYNALIEQFWSPFTNRRTDQYGGSFENRMSFSVELLQAIRKAVGSEFIIGVCTSFDPVVPEVLPLEMMQEIVHYHDQRKLFDYVTVGTGGYYNSTMIIPTAMHPDQFGVPLCKKDSRIRHPCESAGREPYSNAGCCELCHWVRGCRYGQYCKRSNRRPASRQQSDAGTYGRYPALSFLQSDVLGTPLSGLLDQLPD